MLNEVQQFRISVVVIKFLYLIHKKLNSQQQQHHIDIMHQTSEAKVRPVSKSSK